MPRKVGRPRSVTPDKDDLIAFGEDLVKWATEETEQLRCRFPQWYSLLHGISEADFDLMKRKKEFVPYYEQAKVALAERFIDGSVKEGIAHRFLRIYCPEVRQQEDEDARFNESVKRESKESVDEEEIRRLEDMLQSLKSRRQNI